MNPNNYSDDDKFLSLSTIIEFSQFDYEVWENHKEQCSGCALCEE